MFNKTLARLMLISISIFVSVSYAEVSESEFMNIFQAAIVSKDNQALENLVRDNPTQTQNINKKLRNTPTNSPYASELKELGVLLWEASAAVLSEAAAKNGTLPTMEELQNAIKTEPVKDVK